MVKLTNKKFSHKKTKRSLKNSKLQKGGIRPMTIENILECEYLIQNFPRISYDVNRYFDSIGNTIDMETKIIDKRNKFLFHPDKHYCHFDVYPDICEIVKENFKDLFQKYNNMLEYIVENYTNESNSLQHFIDKIKVDIKATQISELEKNYFLIDIKHKINTIFKLLNYMKTRKNDGKGSETELEKKAREFEETERLNMIAREKEEMKSILEREKGAEIAAKAARQAEAERAARAERERAAEVARAARQAEAAEVARAARQAEAAERERAAAAAEAESAERERVSQAKKVKIEEAKAEEKRLKIEADAAYKKAIEEEKLAKLADQKAQKLREEAKKLAEKEAKKTKEAEKEAEKAEQKLREKAEKEAKKAEKEEQKLREKEAKEAKEAEKVTKAEQTTPQKKRQEEERQRQEEERQRQEEERKRQEEERQRQEEERKRQEEERQKQKEQKEHNEMILQLSRNAAQQREIERLEKIKARLEKSNINLREKERIASEARDRNARRAAEDLEREAEKQRRQEPERGNFRTFRNKVKKSSTT